MTILFYLTIMYTIYKTIIGGYYMKFEDFKYVRPDLELYVSNMKAQLDDIANGKDYATEIKAIRNIFDLQDDMDTMYTLVSTRNSVNTKDEFYEKEIYFLLFTHGIVLKIHIIAQKQSSYD